MRRVGAMPGDDGAIGLLSHDKPKKIFTRLVKGIRFWLIADTVVRRRDLIFGDYRLGFSLLNRHSGE